MMPRQSGPMLLTLSFPYVRDSTPHISYQIHLVEKIGRAKEFFQYYEVQTSRLLTTVWSCQKPFRGMSQPQMMSLNTYISLLGCIDFGGEYRYMSTNAYASSIHNPALLMDASNSVYSIPEVIYGRLIWSHTL